MKKHTVKPGDTAESIAQQYDVTVEDLYQYHNKHSQAHDWIQHKITYQKEIFIPPTKEELRLLEARKVKFRSNRLPFIPMTSSYKYGVNISIENGEEKNELKYKTSLTWKQMIGTSHLFNYNRSSEVFINEEQASSIADELAFKTAGILFPTQFLVDYTANWEMLFTENINYQERWQAIKEYIYKEYEGELVDKYLQKIEKIIKTPDILNSYMKDDLFMRSLFIGYCNSFDKEYVSERHLTFPILEQEPRYKVKSIINPELDHYNLINIEIEGVLDDERSKAELINGSIFPMDAENSEKATGNFKAQLFLNPNYNMPEAIYLECDILLEEMKKVTIVIANLSDTGMIRLREENNIIAKENKKIGFWEKLMDSFY
jgi:hypothetical protein